MSNGDKRLQLHDAITQLINCNLIHSDMTEPCYGMFKSMAGASASKCVSVWEGGGGGGGKVRVADWSDAGSCVCWPADHVAQEPESRGPAGHQETQRAAS